MLDMSFVSLVNILISSIDTEEEKKATEDDIRRMFGWQKLEFPKWYTFVGLGEENTTIE